MEDTRHGVRTVESGPSNETWWPSNFMGRLRSVSLFSSKETLSSKESRCEHGVEGLVAYRASQTLWATGRLSEPIPNGFYSIVSERRLKELFDTIPSLDDLQALDSGCLRAEVILVDDKDKKLSMLKQLTVTLVKGLNSNPAAVVKKIAGLVCDFYKRPTMDASSEKSALEEVSHALDNQGVQMLGQIRHGSCHAKAILFKVLADTVDLHSRLVVGLPLDGVMERTDSYKHMSVVVVMNSVELVVDLVRFPGQLMPRSTKAIFMSHVSVAAESDSADYDSCDSPLEPNSPLCGFSERVDVDGAENSDGLQSYHYKLEVPVNVSGPSLRKVMFQSERLVDRNLNSSHSEPNIANAFWRRSKKKVMADQWTASSSPEHPLPRLHGRSMLGGHRDFREYGLDGTSPSGNRRRRRRHSISMIPEIGDDIVRAVRAMNETLKQNRLPREQDAGSFCTNSKDDIKSPHESVSNFHTDDDQGEMSGEKSTAYYFQIKQINSQKAVSLPSSPHQSRRQSSRMGEAVKLTGTAERTLTWNEVLESSKILNKPLLPFQEWNIDFSELTVGTRVGIGTGNEEDDWAC